MRAERSEVVERLKRIFSERSDVELAILFGSVARRGLSLHDVDVAVKLSRPASLMELGELTAMIARELGIREDFVDVVDLDRVGLPLLWRILREGIVLKSEGEALKRLYRRAGAYPDAKVEIEMWANLDPDPKVDKAILESRVAEIRRNVTFLREEILERRIEELSYKDILALERAVHRLAEAMLDICRHLVAVYSLGLVESYGEYPMRLAEAGRMPRALAEESAKLAGLRNILAHGYIEIDTTLLYEATREVVEELAPRFIEWVKQIDP